MIINRPLKTIGLIGLIYLSFASIYLFYGRPNIDEAWYLYASRLVYQGKIPYQDFAFLQMPLFPYLYGLPQKLFGPSLYLGRFTSLLFSFGSFLLAAYIAYHYRGFKAAIATGFLMTSFTYWLYYASLAKFFASLSFFFLLVLYLFSTKLKEHYKLPLIALISLILTGIRASALPFTLVIISYILLKPSPAKSRYLSIFLLLLIASILSVKLFLLPNFPNAYYHLFGNYLQKWGDISFLEKLYQIFFLRIPSIARMYSLYILLFCFLFWSIFKNKELVRFYKDNFFMIIYLTGALLYGAIHFISGEWNEAYLLPTIIAIFPLAGIAFSQVYESTDKAYQPHILWILISVGVLVFLSQGVDYLRNTKNFYKLPEMSAALKKYTSPQDKILALDGLMAVIDADREVLPGLELALFSYHDYPEEEARRLYVVTDKILLEYLKNKIPKAVLITQIDLNMFKKKSYMAFKENPGFVEKFMSTLHNNYYLRQKEDNFGAFSSTAYLYLPKD